MDNINGELRCFCSESICSEDNVDGDNEINNTCLIGSNGYCYVSVNNDEVTYGCFPPEETGLMMCKGRQVNDYMRKFTLCCNDKDFCNANLNPNFTSLLKESLSSLSSSSSPIENTGTIDATADYYTYYLIFLFLVVCATFTVFLYMPKKCLKSISRYREIIPKSHPSTLANHIDFISKINSESFGRVWLVKWRDQSFACRVFGKMEEKLWLHETNIQSKLKNPNVVGLVAKDIGRDAITCSERFLLLIDFFHNRSIYDFLRYNEIDVGSMISLMYSIASGMNYLHNEILGNQEKPSIVHNNIKSHNIMVSSCGSRCLISDFSYAFAYINGVKIVEPPNLSNPSLESLLYRAPETLISNDYQNDEQAGKASDIYSLSLVFWEIISRCKSNINTNETKNGYFIKVPNHKLPYEEELHGQVPSPQKMYEIIFLKGIRPRLNYNVDNLTISMVNHLIKDCWYHQATSRLAISRIMKNLENLQSKFQIQNTYIEKIDLPC